MADIFTFKILFLAIKANNLQIHCQQITEHGDYTDQILEMFRKAYPYRDTIDVLSLYDRTPDVKECQAKAAQGGAPVYNCMVAYEFPLMGGNLMSHTTDLALWFHNLNTRLFEIKGDEETARKVEDQMAGALIAYAYTGDPSTEDLTWDAFTVENGETMIFDDESYMINYPDLELQEVITEATPDSSASEAAESEEAEPAEEAAAAEGESAEGESAEGESTEEPFTTLSEFLFYVFPIILETDRPTQLH